MRKRTKPRKAHLQVLDNAIKYFGSQRVMAGALGTSQQIISDWLCENFPIPAEAAIKIEVLTEGRFTVKELRPDLFKLKPFNPEAVSA